MRQAFYLRAASALLVAGLGGVLCIQPAHAWVSYQKEYYFTPYRANAPVPIHSTPEDPAYVQGGGVFRGWADPPLWEQAQAIYSDEAYWVVSVPFIHALDQVDTTKNLREFVQPANGGGEWYLPIQPTTPVATFIPEAGSTNWGYGAYTSASPSPGPYPEPLPAVTGDVVGNWADGRVTINPLVDTEVSLATWPALECTIYRDSAYAMIDGRATAGRTPAPPFHTFPLSADSFAAMSIPNVNIDPWEGGSPREWLFAGRNRAEGHAERYGVCGVRDRYFISVTDMHDEDEPTATVSFMVQHLDAALSGSFQIDDTGISLSVSLDVPGSFAGIGFSTDSNWTQSPYNYGATLRSDGVGGFDFDAWGLTPLEGWVLEAEGGCAIATFSFGDEGLPYDYAYIIPPPGWYFEALHDYAFSPGASDGGFDVVPEPSMVVLLASGLVAALALWYRKRR